MKVKTRPGRVLDVPPMMVRNGRAWDPIRQAYYPRLWPQALPTTLLACTLGWFGSQIRPGWLMVVVIVGGSFVLGSATSKLRWWIWKRRNPPLPGDQWLRVELLRRAREKREAARWN